MMKYSMYTSFFVEDEDEKYAKAENKEEAKKAL